MPKVCASRRGCRQLEGMSRGESAEKSFDSRVGKAENSTKVDSCQLARQHLGRPCAKQDIRPYKREPKSTFLLAAVYWRRSLSTPNRAPGERHVRSRSARDWTLAPSERPILSPWAFRPTFRHVLPRKSIESCLFSAVAESLISFSGQPFRP